MSNEPIALGGSGAIVLGGGPIALGSNNTPLGSTNTTSAQNSDQQANGHANGANDESKKPSFRFVDELKISFMRKTIPKRENLDGVNVLR